MQMPQQIPAEDVAKMQDMVEKFKDFLHKYEGFGVVISSCHFWRENQIQTQTRIEFTKMDPPKAQNIQKAFS